MFNKKTDIKNINECNQELKKVDGDENDGEGVSDNDGKFSGALVADPKLNTFTGIEIMGVKSKYAFNNVVDMDFSSMYPNIIIPFNNGPHTMIGKVISTFTPEDKLGMPKYDAGQDLIDNMIIDNPLNFGTKWLDLPDGIAIEKMIRSNFNITRRVADLIDKLEVEDTVTISVEE